MHQNSTNQNVNGHMRLQGLLKFDNVFPYWKDKTVQFQELAFILIISSQLNECLLISNQYRGFLFLSNKLLYHKFNSLEQQTFYFFNLTVFLSPEFGHGFTGLVLCSGSHGLQSGFWKSCALQSLDIPSVLCGF